MNQFIQSIFFVNLFNLAIAGQSSIIFPGSTRSTFLTSTENEWSASTNFIGVRNVGRVFNNYANRLKNTNSIAEKDEESSAKKKPNNFDELPYDFSKTDRIHRVSDLLRFLGIEDQNRTNDDGGLTVRKSADDPTQVGCHTEMRTVDLAVELKKNTDDIKLFPECVKAKRCAGCCGFNSGRVCTPTKKEKINVYAAVIRVKRSCDESTCSSEIDKDNLRKIESHEECACRCKLTEEDCNENQEYDDGSCKCLCKDNESMRSTCEKNVQKKWSEKNCQCECKKVLACSTGLVFTHKTCSCARRG